MALALCLTLLPATALAADPHTHCLCGAKHNSEIKTHKEDTKIHFETKLYSQGNYEWYTKTGMGSAGKLGFDTTNKQWLLPAGNYYLDDGSGASVFSTDYTIKIQGNVTICLNGKEIKKTKGDATPVFEVPSGFTLTLTDCNGSGKVTCGTTSSDSGSGVHVNGGIFNLYEGQITGNKGQEDKNTDRCGGGVYVEANGTFNMYGGSITGNSASYGGGVYVKSGKFEMNGGTITDNTSNKGGGEGSGGAGVYVEKSGTFIMNNAASVTGNKIKRLSNGGGVYVNGGTFTMNGSSKVANNIADYRDGTLNGGGVYVSGGNFEMNKNASVTGNKANQGTALNGAGVYVSGTKSTFIMNGDASVKSNTASDSGGGVYVYSGTFNMNGDSTIGGATTADANTATKNGGGVCVERGTFTMNGNASITGNTANQDGGGVNAAGGTFAMNGSSKVMNNTGNGVYVIGATFTVSDKPTVTGNTKGSTDSAASNVYLTGSAYITIGGTLNEGASIGVTKTSALLVATGNRELTTEDAAKFKSNRDGYVVSVDPTNNKQLVLKRISGQHMHDWTYALSQDKATITATCQGEGECTYKNTPATVTIRMTQSTYTYSENMDTPTAKLTYDNWPENLAKPQESQIEYYKYANDSGYSAMYGDPKDVGKYKASITVEGVTASVKYEITKKQQASLSLRSDKNTLAVGETLTLFVDGGSGSGKVVYQALGDGNSAATIDGDVLTAVSAGKVTVTAVKEGDTEFAEAKSEPLTITITEKTGGGSTPSQPGGSTGGNTGGSSSGSSSSGSSDSNPIIKTETKNNPDGSTTKTETRKDGSVTQTTTAKDGSVSKTETKKDGSSVTENKAADGSTGTVKTDKHGQTEASAKVSAKAVEDAKKNGEAVKAPVEVEASRNSNTAPVVKVELPKGAGETKVEIPVSNVKSGTVAVLVHPDGTEEIVKNSLPTENGIQLTVNGGATVKIVDNAKDFIDTRAHWAKDAIDFVSARELVNGISATRYAPDASATRAQLWTILARQNDANLSGGNTWYEKAQLWSKDKGISDGTQPDATTTRAQIVTMMWRAAGSPAAQSGTAFQDVAAGSYYAQAVAWAVENGITAGVGGGRFDPDSICTRAQIATFLAQSMK